MSVTLLSAQRLLPGRTGIASGVILGLGFITGGLGVPITGALADHWSIDGALMSLSILCVLAAVLAWTTNDMLYRSGESLEAVPVGESA